MNLDRLREFVVVADSGNIRQAAAELELSAPTLGARLRTFEQSLGYALFDRSHAKMTLTKEGSLLYKDALAITKEYQELKQELASINETDFSSLTIAVADFGLPFYLGPFLDLLNTRYPQIQLNLLNNSKYSIGEGLRLGQIDLYFASALEQYQIEGVTRILISHSQPYVLLPSSHRFASRAHVSIRELAQERFILYPSTKENCVRDFQLANLQAARIPFSLYEHHTSPAFYELLVPIQKGIILSPTPILHVPPNASAVPLTDLKYEASSFLYYCRDSQKPEVKYFVDAFHKFIAAEKNHEYRKAL